MDTEDPSERILGALAGLRSCAYCRELLTSDQHALSSEHLARCGRWSRLAAALWTSPVDPAAHPASSPLLGGSFRCDGSYRLGGENSTAPRTWVPLGETLLGRLLAERLGGPLPASDSSASDRPDALAVSPSNPAAVDAMGRALDFLAGTLEPTHTFHEGPTTHPFHVLVRIAGEDYELLDGKIVDTNRGPR